MRDAERDVLAAERTRLPELAAGGGELDILPIKSRLF